jgi:hypothetical protein
MPAPRASRMRRTQRICSDINFTFTISKRGRIVTISKDCGLYSGYSLRPPNKAEYQSTTNILLGVALLL